MLTMLIEECLTDKEGIGMRKKRWIAIGMAVWMVFGMLSGALAETGTGDVPAGDELATSTNGTPIEGEPQPPVVPPVQPPEGNTGSTEQPKTEAPAEATPTPAPAQPPTEAPRTAIGISVSCSGQAIVGGTCTVSVSLSGLTVAPKGSVTFTAGGSVIASGVPVVGGGTAVSWTPKSAGSFTVTAQYVPGAGDAYLAASGSCSVEVGQGAGGAAGAQQPQRGRPVPMANGRGFYYGAEGGEGAEGEEAVSGRYRGKPEGRIIADMIETLRKQAEELEESPKTPEQPGTTGPGAAGGTGEPKEPGTPDEPDEPGEPDEKKGETLGGSAGIQGLSAQVGAPALGDLLLTGGEGNQAGKKNINGCEIDMEVGEPGEDGAPAVPVVTIVDEGKTLVLGTDYTVDMIDGKVIIEGIGDDYTGKVVWTIGNAAPDEEEEGGGLILVGGEEEEEEPDADGLRIVLLDPGAAGNYYGEDSVNYTYTGEAIEPLFAVFAGASELVEGTDYTSAVSNNTDEGMATITVTGMGEYEGKSAVATFWILPEGGLEIAPMAFPTSAMKLSVSLTGNVLRVSATVTDDGVPPPPKPATTGQVVFAITGPGGFSSAVTIATVSAGVFTNTPITLPLAGYGVYTVQADYTDPTNVPPNTPQTAATTVNYAAAGGPVTLGVTGGRWGNPAVLTATFAAAAVGDTVTFYANGVAINTVTLAAGATSATYTYPWANISRGTTTYTAVYTQLPAPGATVTITINSNAVTIQNGRAWDPSRGSYRYYYTPGIDLTAKATGSGRATLTATMTPYGSGGYVPYSTNQSGAYYWPGAVYVSPTNYYWTVPSGTYSTQTWGYRNASGWNSRAGVPTGTVFFYSGDKYLGSADLVDGVATFAWKNVSNGTHTVRAVYQGNRYYGVSSAQTTLRMTSGGNGRTQNTQQKETTGLSDVQLRDENGKIIETYDMAGVIMQDGVLTINTKTLSDFFSYGFMAPYLKNLSGSSSGHFNILTDGFNCLVPYSVGGAALDQYLASAGVSADQVQLRVSVRELLDQGLLSAYQAANAGATNDISFYRVEIGLYDLQGVKLSFDPGVLTNPITLMLPANRLSGTAQRYDERGGSFSPAAVTFTDNYAVLTVDQNGVYVVAMDAF